MKVYSIVCSCGTIVKGKQKPWSSHTGVIYHFACPNCGVTLIASEEDIEYGSMNVVVCDTHPIMKSMEES